MHSTGACIQLGRRLAWAVTKFACAAMVLLSWRDETAMGRRRVASIGCMPRWRIAESPAVLTVAVAWIDRELAGPSRYPRALCSDVPFNELIATVPPGHRGEPRPVSRLALCEFPDHESSSHGKSASEAEAAMPLVQIRGNRIRVSVYMNGLNKYYVAFPVDKSILAFPSFP